MDRNYAEIVDNRVVRVVVINGEWTEQQAQDWLHANVSANTWIETKSDGSLRNKYAGIGDEYKADLDVFVFEKPFVNWKFDEERLMYIPPFPKPIAIVVGYVWRWSQQLLEWIGIER